ncbi:MAG: DEAD/DEAH box helicase, partial [Pseudomonadota bacterium]
MTNFNDLGLHKQVAKAVASEGYETPTPIQAQSIPHLLEGRDLLGIAQTGTGKTAAFALPTLDHLVKNVHPREAKLPRALVLAPTRELAMQITESFRTYARFMDCVVQSVFGGVKIGRQIQALRKGCHVLVATPGRLLDLMNQDAVRLDAVEVLVLDEADQML